MSDNPKQDSGFDRQSTPQTKAIDPFGRRIRYLRISVTDRCNFRCGYCMPSHDFEMLDHDDILRYEEIMQVATAAAKMGFNKMRVTGGEPLVRRNIEALIRDLAALPGVDDLSMTTNAHLLAGKAEGLVAAGLNRVNISLDAIDPDRFRTITGGGEIEPVLAGIRAAARAGLHPIKLNCVCEDSSQEPDARDVAAFALSEGHQVRFIKRMDIAEGSFSVVEGGEGGNCPSCNRLRLSSDGNIRPCLFSNLSYSVRELGAEEALIRAISGKPRAGTSADVHWMRGIGG
jgi:GTP 3',8-cyclase